MLWILGSVTAAALCWAVVSYIAARSNGPLKTGQYVALGVVPMIAIFGIGLGSVPIATAASQQDAVGGYHEKIEGSYIDAKVERIVCERDGACARTYDCDHYTVWETVIDYDSKGNAVGSHQVPHDAWHDCPYATEEFNYWLRDNIEFPKDHNQIHQPDEWQHIFAANPQKWRGEGDGDADAFPNDVLRGAPALWQEVNNAKAHGDSVGMAIDHEYTNPILASTDTILKAYSDKITLLKGKNLLPEHTKNLREPLGPVTLVSQMQFVCFQPSNEPAWQRELRQMNAGLGSMKVAGRQLQGNLYVVAIKASCIPASVSPQDFLNALKAYWLNGLDKYALAKNGIALVLAVDDSASTIAWSAATTGMPIGNGAMLQALSNDLVGKPFTVDSVFGHTTGRVLSAGDKPQVQYVPGSGIVPQTIMVQYPFERACMDCESAEDQGKTGFVYLSSELPLDGTHTFWAIVIDLMLCGLLFWGSFSLYMAIANFEYNKPYRSLDSELPYSRSATEGRYDLYGVRPRITTLHNPLAPRNPRGHKKGNFRV